MSTITKSQRSKAALPRRWSSTGHHDARPNAASDLNRAPIASSDLTVDDQSDQIRHINTDDHQAWAQPLPSGAPAAAVKSP